MRNKLVVGAVAILLILAGMYVWTGWHGSRRVPTGVPHEPNVPAAQDGHTPSTADVGDSVEAVRQTVEPKTERHPLCAGTQQMVLAEGVSGVVSTAGAELSEIMQAIARSGRDADPLPPLTIDYPLDESVFPPDFLPPTFLWHDDVGRLDTWLVEFAFGGEEGDPDGIYVLAPGDPPPSGEIDPRCVTDTNEVYQPTPYQASAKAWTPSGEVWDAVKRRSVERPVHVTVLGFRSAEPDRALSRGRVTVTTSRDPVGAPIFYRDVPLAPSKTQAGVIKPLSEASLPLIAWRLRDVGRPDSRLLVTGLLTCSRTAGTSFLPGRRRGIRTRKVTLPPPMPTIPPRHRFSMTCAACRSTMDGAAGPNRLPARRPTG